MEDIAERVKRIRYNIVKMVDVARSGHVRGSLSAVEIVATLFFAVMRLDPAHPDWTERDRFILSNGHASPVFYATLAERGFFAEDALWIFRRCGSMLQGHPDMNKTPGVDMSTGPLGQGLSVGSAVAEVLSERHPTRMKRIGLKDTFGESGTAIDLYNKFGLTPENIASEIKLTLSETLS